MFMVKKIVDKNVVSIDSIRIEILLQAGDQDETDMM